MNDVAQTCWWLAEALAHPEFRGDPAPALDRDVAADVVVIGGGYTGLWAAWHLVQACPGIDVVVLEQDECGFGPYALGYTGNGVGPAHLFGRILAAKAMGVETADTRLAFVDMEPTRFPPQPFRSVGAAIVNAATVRRDDALDATGRVDPVTDFVARLPRRMGYHLGP